MAYNREEIREKYGDLFEHSLDLIYVNNLNGDFLDANDLTLLALGYEREEIPKIRFLDILEEDEIKKAYGVLKEIIKSGKQSKREEYKVKAKNGNFIHIETYGIPLKKNGKIYAILGIGKNITDRKKVEQKLRNSREMFRALYKESPIATYTWKKYNNDFVFIDFNNAAEKITNGNVVSVLGYKASEQYRDRPDILDDLFKCFNERTNITREIKYQFAYNNEEKYLLVKYGYVEPDLVIVQTEDITEKRVAEEKLRQSELKYRNMINNLDVGFYQVTLDGVLLNRNPTYNKILGFEISEDLRNSIVTELWQQPELRKDYLNQMLRDDYVQGYVCHALRKSGERIVLELNSHLIRDKQGNPERIDGIFIDITEKFTLERELKESEEKFRNITEYSLLGIAILQDNKIEYVNEAMSSINEFTIQEMMNWTPIELLKIIHPEDQQRAIEYLKKKQAGDSDLTPYNSYRIITKSGKIRWVDAYSKSIIHQGRFAELILVADVSERKRAQEKLKESEEIFRTITEQSLLGICILQDNLIKYINQQFADLLGYTVEEVKNWKSGWFANVIHSEDREWVMEQARKKQSGAKDVKHYYQYRLIKKTGETIWLENFSKTILYMGRPANLVTVIDITERKLAEQKLKESEEKYRNLVENAQEGVWATDENDETIFVNPKICEMLGYTKDEMMGKNLDLFLEDSMLELVNSYRKRREKGLKDTYELEFIKKDGTLLNTNIKAAPILTESGEFKGSFAYVTDITNRKIAEQKLKKSEEKYRLISENANDIITKINEKLVIEYINEQACLYLLGYSRDEMVGKSTLEFVHPEEVKRIINELNKGLKEGTGITETKIKHKNGHYIWFEVTGKVVVEKDGKKKGILIARDITKRKDTEQKLKESELKYRQLIESAPYSIGLIDLKGNLLDCNSATNKLLSVHTREDLIGKSFIELFSGNEENKHFIPIFQKYFKDLLNRKLVKSFEFPLTRSIGGIIWLSVSASLIKIEDKSMIQFIIQDITEKKNAEQKLKESEEKYRLISESANDLIVLLNEKYEFDYINEEVHRKLMGYSKGDLIGKPAIDFVHPDDVKIAVEALKRGILSGEGSEEIRYKHKKGHWVWLHIKGKTFIGQDGKGKGLLISRDITERKKSERELIESEKKFRRIFESIPDLYFLVDSDTKILDCKGKEADLYLPPELFLGKKLTDVMPTKIRELSLNTVKNTIKTQQPQLMEYALPIKNKTRHFEARHLFFSEDRVAIFVREITDRKKAEDLIRKEIQKLKELDQIRKDLISRVSHELKTPLVSVCGASELLLEIFKDNFKGDTKELVEMIEKGGKRLKYLIDNLLDISRLEYNKFELEKESTELGEIIRNCVKEMKYLIKKRDLILELNFQDDLNLILDKIRIEQVILNLLSNAIKNTPPHEIITIELFRKGDWAEITVRDTGIGLTREEMDRIFTRFGKIERYGDGLEFIDIQGSGLGLFISKEIVDLHGGNIRAESEGRNKGSTFIVKLPL